MKTDWSKAFHLPWNQSDSYWLYVLLPEEAITPELEQALQVEQMQKVKAASSHFVLHTNRQWDEPWRRIHAALIASGRADQMTVSVIPGEEQPGVEEIFLNRRPVDAIHGIAENLWLGEALQNGLITCYLQPVIDKRGKTFGYESFARMELQGGELIGGGKIIAASKALNIEFLLDRYLHVQAIKTFISSDCGGFLFVNFVPGFIQRPEVYLEGLTETVQSFGMAAKHIVLDFTRSETQKDMSHLKRVCDYCRAKGYSLSLDDVASLETASKLVAEVKPDFLKLDMKLVRSVAQPHVFSLISQMVEVTHKAGCTILAEGVETQEVHDQLLKAGVDLFQGYLFSPPTPVAKTQRAEASGGLA